MLNLLKNMKIFNSDRILKRFNIKNNKNIIKMHFSNSKIVKVTEDKLFLKKDDKNKIKEDVDELMMRASMII